MKQPQQMDRLSDAVERGEAIDYQKEMALLALHFVQQDQAFAEEMSELMKGIPLR